MSTNTWLLVKLAMVHALIVVTSFFVFRAQRTKMNRQLLMPFGFHLVIWSNLALFLFEGMFRLMFLAAIIGIYAPAFFWILRSARDDHAG